jgi:ribokinase
VNVIAARVAKQSGTQVILDVGGRDEPFSPDLLQYVDILSPNETELIRVLGKKPKDEEEHDKEIDKLLRQYPNMKLLLKKGEFGSALYYLEDPKTPETSKLVLLKKPAYSFDDFPDLKLVDTTGAGDCFTGAFATEMLEDVEYDVALEYANQVGFLCITKFGAGPSIPTREDVEKVFGPKKGMK